MKRINMLPPFESFQGNMGSKQDLRYPTNDNKAYEAPAGKVSYAKNYQPRFIAARVARTGINYFAVKTKSAFKATAKALKQCALMGATSAIYGISIKDATKLIALEAAYSLAVADGFEGTFHKFCHEQIMNCLALGSATIVVAYGTSSVNLGNNPYSDAATAIAISSKLLVKFWKQLTPNGISFRVDGAKGIAISHQSFEQVIDKTRVNVLSLSLSGEQVKLGDKWLLDIAGGYVDFNVGISDGDIFTLTDVAPE